MNRWQRAAWIAILVADVGFMLWGGAGALAPDHLAGPGGVPILTAGYEGFTNLAWSDLAATSPRTAEYVKLLFRLYSTFCVIFGLLTIAITVTAFRRGERWAWWVLLLGNTLAYGAAMTYDRLVSAIGPFELTEYLGIAVVWGALAVTAPFRAAARPVSATSS
jgi:hypothetical protein